MFEELMDFTLEEQGLAVSFRVIRMGSDILVLAAGGDAGHIGAVTLGGCRDRESAVRAGHKEQVVTELMYEVLAPAVLNGLAVAAGIHVEAIRPEQIDQVVKLCRLGADKIAAFMKKNRE